MTTPIVYKYITQHKPHRGMNMTISILLYLLFNSSHTDCLILFFLFLTIFFFVLFLSVFDFYFEE